MTATFCALASVTWLVRGALAFALPTYYAPQTPLDFAAVWSFSAALVLSSLSLVALALQLTGMARTAALAGAGAALTAAIGNAAEDAFAVDAGWMIYVLGALGTLAAFVTLAVSFFRAERRPPALAFGAAALGFLLADVGGLILTGLAFAALAWLGATRRIEHLG